LIEKENIQRGKLPLLIAVLLCIVSMSTVHAQFGFAVKLQCVFGSHKRNVSLKLEGQYIFSNAECALGTAMYYKMKTIGSSAKTPLLKLFAHTQWWSADTLVRPYLRNEEINTDKGTLCGAYEYAYYFDRIGTSQATGRISMWIADSYISIENDFLGALHSDKYRTSLAEIGYGTGDYFIILKNVLWTGDAFGTGVKTVRDSDYPSRFGYKNLQNAPWGTYSAGILACEFRYATPYCTDVFGSLGIDAEQVRNIFQNKFMHDMWFMPAKFIGYKVPNYPMLKDDGTPYLYSDGERPRKPKLYYEVGVNERSGY